MRLTALICPGVPVVHFETLKIMENKSNCVLINSLRDDRELKKLHH
jgi:hypothetical protein